MLRILKLAVSTVEQATSIWILVLVVHVHPAKENLQILNSSPLLNQRMPAQRPVTFHVQLVQDQRQMTAPVVEQVIIGVEQAVVSFRNASLVQSQEESHLTW